MSKPRLCNILGVEVGQQFHKADNDIIYFVDDDGHLKFLDKEGNIWLERESRTLEDLINNPDKVIRWTEKDTADINAIKQLWPEAIKLRRDKDPYSNKIYLYISFKQFSEDNSDDNDYDVVLTKSTVVPSLRIGETFYMNDDILINLNSGDEKNC